MLALVTLVNTPRVGNWVARGPLCGMLSWRMWNVPSVIAALRERLALAEEAMDQQAENWRHDGWKLRAFEIPGPNYVRADIAHSAGTAGRTEMAMVEWAWLPVG